jgi:glycosyltransferase involved in cell wall biosynthesis
MVTPIALVDTTEPKDCRFSTAIPSTPLEGGSDRNLNRSPQPGPLSMALSLLCESPSRPTGLSSLFKEFVRRSIDLDSNLRWIVFVGPDYDFGPVSDRVTLCRNFSGNDNLGRRLYADHLLVSWHAERMGAQALLTVGFVPVRQGIPTIMHLFTLHHLSDSNHLDPIRSVYRSWATTQGLRAARLVITNSRFAANQITTVVPAVKGKVIQSYEGVDHSVFNPVQPPEEKAELDRALGLPPKYILWLSNLYPYKQADLLLRSHARLPAALREEYPIVFVGGDWSNQRALLEQLAAQLSVTIRLQFLEWVEQRWIAPLLRQARILALPSREETFGRPVAEAMACGTPCVVNDIPIMHEVTNGAAWITDFANLSGAAYSLAEALTDETQRADVIQRGLIRARDFDFDKLTRERLIAIYKSLDLTNDVQRLGA